MWDPRQVELNAMSGTREPKSATGATGPGLVPRDPEVLTRLVAGFNGGFQAMHGEYGMMSDGVVYLPPKPYAATVARLTDGSTGFGTWPEDDTIPPEIVSFRQNMTPLIMDSRVNPYHRQWWGGVPPGWEDTSKTVRTGLCLTREHFAAYFYGSRADVDHISSAMQQARCDYGIHLDMNPGHTGLEFYNVDREGRLPSLSRKLNSEWEAEGAVPHIKGWRFRGRRMIRRMALMHFPRYIHRESRDFFYLTLRPLLPGAHLTPVASDREPGEGVWVVSGLPQHGWPHAMATTWLRPDPKRRETKVWILRVDPRRVTPECHQGTRRPTVLTLSTSHSPSAKQSIWWTSEGLWLGDTPSDGPSLRMATGSTSVPRKAVSAAAGIDGEKMFVYAEIATAPDRNQDGALLHSLLKQMGCSRPVLLSERLQVALGGQRDLAGHPVALQRDTSRLCRFAGPGGQLIFKDTPVVARRVWEPLQAKRVRYFRKPKRPDAGAEDELASPGIGASQSSTGQPADTGAAQ
jgi:hypothetical protein